MSNFVEMGWAQNLDTTIGYRVYRNQNENALTLFDDLVFAELADPANPLVRYWNLPAYGRWFFAITAYDAANNESPPTNMLSKLIGGDDSMGGGGF